MMNLATQSTSSDDFAVAAAPASRAGHGAALAAAALVALAAIVVRAVSPEGTDISWLLTVCERMLDGQRLYVDVLETNPPASPLIYMPGVAAARVLGVSSELMTGVFAGLAVVMSGLLTLAILRAGNLLRDSGTFILALVFAVGFMPLEAFAQREHFALLGVLPIVALSAARAEARPVALALALAAGVGGGFAMCVKPYFALAILFPYLFAAWRRRSLRPIFSPENFLAGALVLAYGAAVAVFYPDFYATLLPVLAETYRQERQALLFLLRLPQAACYGLLAAIAIMALRPRRWPALPTVLLLASAAFPLAYLDQGKGWGYHLLPGLAFALLSIWTALLLPASSKEGERGYIVPGLALVGAFLVAITLAPRPAANYALAAAVERVGPPAPTILVIGPDMSVGHPLTRMVGGTWAGRAPSQWMSRAALHLASSNIDDMDLRRRMQAYLDRDRAVLREDMALQPPDILIFDRRFMDWLAWARRDPAFVEAMRPYEPVENVEGLEIWRRL